MAFVLEKITEEMRQKIIDDAACDDDKLFALRIKGSILFFGENIAIDTTKDFYLCNKPISIKTDGWTSSYFFHFHKKFYEIYIKGLFEGELVEFVDAPPEGAVFEEFKNAIREAFAVFGRSGFEPTDIMNKINAQFNE